MQILSHVWPVTKKMPCSWSHAMPFGAHDVDLVVAVALGLEGDAGGGGRLCRVPRGGRLLAEV